MDVGLEGPSDRRRRRLRSATQPRDTPGVRSQKDGARRAVKPASRARLLTSEAGEEKRSEGDGSSDEGSERKRKRRRTWLPQYSSGFVRRLLRPRMRESEEMSAGCPGLEIERPGDRKVLPAVAHGRERQTRGVYLGSHGSVGLEVT